MNVDVNIIEATKVWISHGLKPGSCTELLLRGDYERAFLHAHPMIKPFWEDHIKFIETLPIECRGENFDNWEQMKRKNCEETMLKADIKELRHKDPELCELDGPYECSECGGHMSLDASFLLQVSEIIICPYCKSLMKLPAEQDKVTT